MILIRNIYSIMSLYIMMNVFSNRTDPDVFRFLRLSFFAFCNVFCRREIVTLSTCSVFVWNVNLFHLILIVHIVYCSMCYGSWQRFVPFTLSPPSPPTLLLSLPLYLSPFLSLSWHMHCMNGIVGKVQFTQRRTDTFFP